MRSSFGRVLQDLMESRGIETKRELALRIKHAGYGRSMYQSILSQWVAGASRPKNIPKFCHYLDIALDLSEDEKAAVARAVGRSAYPVPRQLTTEKTT